MEAKKNFIINIGFYGIIAVLLLLAGTYILPIMIPFIIAFIVAALLHSAVKRLNIRSSRVNRVVSIAFCVAFYAIVMLIFTLLSTRVVAEAGGLIASIPRFFTETIVPAMQMLTDQLESAALQYDQTLANLIDQAATSALQTLGNFVTSFSGRALRFVTGLATGIPGLLIKVIITIVSTFFMALDFDKVVGALSMLIPKGKRELVNTSASYTRKMLWVYAKSYTLLFTLTFCELTLGFVILDIPYALVLAFIIAIFDIMPILGLGGVLLPWALVLLALGNLKLAAGIAALYVIITVIRQALEPRIIGTQIGLHPLATLIAMILGLGLFGIVGLFGFPVALAVMLAMNRTKKNAQAEKQRMQEQAKQNENRPAEESK